MGRLSVLKLIAVIPIHAAIDTAAAAADIFVATVFEIVVPTAVETPEVAILVTEDRLFPTTVAELTAELTLAAALKNVWAFVLIPAGTFRYCPALVIIFIKSPKISDV